MCVLFVCMFVFRVEIEESFWWNAKDPQSWESLAKKVCLQSRNLLYCWIRVWDPALLRLRQKICWIVCMWVFILILFSLCLLLFRLFVCFTFVCKRILELESRAFFSLIEIFNYISPYCLLSECTSVFVCVCVCVPIRDCVCVSRVVSCLFISLCKIDFLKLVFDFFCLFSFLIIQIVLFFSLFKLYPVKMTTHEETFINF